MATKKVVTGKRGPGRPRKTTVGNDPKDQSGATDQTNTDTKTFLRTLVMITEKVENLQMKVNTLEEELREAKKPEKPYAGLDWETAAKLITTDNRSEQARFDQWLKDYLAMSSDLRKQALGVVMHEVGHALYNRIKPEPDFSTMTWEEVYQYLLTKDKS